MLQRVVPLLSFVAVGRHYTSNICRSHQISEQRWIAGWEAASATRSISWLGRTDGRDDLAAGLRILVIYVQHVLTICGWWSPMITMFRWVETTSRSCVSMFIWNEFLVGYLLEIQYLLKRDPAYLYIYWYIYVCISTWYAYPMDMVESNYVGSNARYPGNTLYSPNSNQKSQKYIQNGWRDAIMSCAFEIARSLLRLENHDTDLSSKTAVDSTAWDGAGPDVWVINVYLP